VGGLGVWQKGGDTQTQTLELFIGRERFGVASKKPPSPPATEKVVTCVNRLARKTVDSTGPKQSIAEKRGSELRKGWRVGMHRHETEKLGGFGSFRSAIKREESLGLSEKRGGPGGRGPETK